MSSSKSSPILSRPGSKIKEGDLVIIFERFDAVQSAVMQKGAIYSSRFGHL